MESHIDNKLFSHAGGGWAAAAVTVCVCVRALQDKYISANADGPRDTA